MQASSFVHRCIGADAAPVGMQDLRSAQAGLSALVHGHMRRSLQCDPEPTAPLAPLASGETPELMGCLRLLAHAWRHPVLRGVLCGRYLPHQLSGLLQVVTVPSEALAPHAAWCEARLEELVAAEEVLPLLEALSALLRLPSAPPWLRAAVAARLSQCMMRPGGVASLVLCLHARGGEAPEAQPAVEELTVRLLRSVPAAGG